jgi:hypothetical protein
MTFTIEKVSKVLKIGCGHMWPYLKKMSLEPCFEFIVCMPKYKKSDVCEIRLIFSQVLIFSGLG